MRHTHEKEVLTRDDGMPIDYVDNGNRIVRVAPDSWQRMLRHRCVGIAPGTEDTSDGTPTFLRRNLYDPTICEVVNVSAVRRTSAERASTPKVTEARQLTEAERFLPSMVEIVGQYN